MLVSCLHDSRYLQYSKSEIYTKQRKSWKNQQIFRENFSPKELINYECASFLEPVNWSVSVSPRKYMLRIISYPYLSLSDLYSSLRFNMASPIAFRHGLKNAGRLTNLLSLTPKVCYLYKKLLYLWINSGFKGIKLPSLL